MSLLEYQREAIQLRRRLRNPPNAVEDDGIDLKRPKKERRPEPAPEPSATPQCVAAEPAEIPTAPQSIEDRIRELKYELAALQRRMIQESESPKVILPSIPSISRIVKIVAEQYNLSPIEILSDRRAAHIVWARHIAMYLSRSLTLRSLPSIGRQMCRDHSTVKHGIDKIVAAMARDSELAVEIDRLADLIRNSPLS